MSSAIYERRKASNVRERYPGRRLRANTGRRLAPPPFLTNPLLAKRNILSKLAQLAGFASAPLGSTLEVTAGSVIIVAKFPVVTQSEASAAQSSLTQSSVAAGQDSFEAQIGPILATVGASVNDAVVVEVDPRRRPLWRPDNGELRNPTASLSHLSTLGDKGSRTQEAHRRLLYAAARRGLALVFALVRLRHRRLLLLLGLVLGGLLLLLRRRRLCLPSSPAGLLATCK